MANVFKLKNDFPNKKVTQLAGIIEERFDGELVCNELQELNDNTKVLVMNYEKYYFRVSSYVGLTIVITEFNVSQTAIITGFGGGNGLLNISWGANGSFAVEMAELLKEFGFEEQE